MRKPLILLGTILLLAAQSTQTIDSDIVFDEDNTNEVEGGFFSRVLNRVKRGLFDNFWGDSKSESSSAAASLELSTTTEAAAASSSRETRSPDDEEVSVASERQPPDDEDNGMGSGDIDEGSGEVPVLIPSSEDIKPTLYRMTIIVEQPWRKEFSSPTSSEFKTFSEAFEHDIEELYQSLPGEQKTDVISIDKTPDTFFVKVTVDLRSTDYSDAKEIENHILRQIEEKKRIGSHTVGESGFTFNTFRDVCKETELLCPLSNTCVLLIYRCDGEPQCPDGEDEEGCPSSLPSSTTSSSISPSSAVTDEISSTTEVLIRETELKCRGDTSPITCKDHPEVEICPDKKCDGRLDCPFGDDEENCPKTDCLQSEFICDLTRCLPDSQVCDGKSDCSDETDESPTMCESKQCKDGDFKCKSGKCISYMKRCDFQNDCPDGDDEERCTSPRVCSADQFTCQDLSQCIPQSSVCDKRPDCQDKSDELNCQRDCSASEFKCANGDCIPEYSRCDRIVDCSDRSDEENCPRCKSDQFTCADGYTCISISERCDGHFNCPSRDDEQNCPGVCHESQFRCSNGVCIPSESRCNGTPECADSSDEEGCDDIRDGCFQNEFRCRNGVCINKEYACDDIPDCSDGSDEDNCQKRQCEATDFICHSDRKCISSSSLCDGKVDCRDGSDEENINCRPCHPTQFSCNTGECIDLSRRCDGVQDCPDNSDETNNDCLPPRPVPPPVIPAQVICSENQFACWSGDKCIPSYEHCNGRYDCADRSDEENCAGIPPPELKIYEGDQIIKETREAVFRCRDEGLGRFRVRWSRERGLSLPPGSRDLNGRLEIPNVQREHSGTYYCEAVGVSPTIPGARVSVHLTVEQLLWPTHAPFPEACGPGEATCHNRECILKSEVCDGKFDCGDGSDETRCHRLQQPCEPNEFHCSNRKCILKSWRCDKEDDCGDGSDEVGCDVIKPGTGCNENEFECRSKNQCIPRHFHCDKTNDCQDGSDELGCYPMQIVHDPPPFKDLLIGSTLVISCEAIGVPTPVISWRWNWKNVPAKCTMESVEGKGTLTCPDMQPQDSGAYSCEAINVVTYIIGKQDTIVTVTGSEPSCANGTFNELAKSQRECIPCFCFGVSDSCQSANLFVYQLPPPTRIFRLLNVYVSPNWIDVRVHEESSLQPHLRSNTEGFRIQSAFGSRAYESVYPYYVLPEPAYHGNQLKSYGGYLSYVLLVDSLDSQLDIPEIIITGNGRTLLYKYPGPIRENSHAYINASISESAGWELLKANESRVPASRQDIMMTLVNVDKILIRTQYTTGQGVMTTFANLTMDSASYSNTGLGKAAYVEQCDCPEGYTGLSCEECAENYIRVARPPWLGVCVRDRKCPRSYFGNPSMGIPCQKCPCPLTTPPNQFTEDCFLDTDFSPTCKCPEGYSGRRCEVCASGYIGNPLQAGGECRRPPEPQCDPIGSHSPYPRNERCDCKDLVTGRTCSECSENSFYLSPSNQFGCISCFCMGITDSCTSSRLYRDQITATFARDNQNMTLAPEDDISNPVDARVIPGSSELSFDQFQPKVYYWILPRKFSGDHVKSYGGFLEYRFRYVPTPGGQSSRNNAADIKLYSSNRVNLFYYGNTTVEPDREQVIRAPLLEQYWQQEDGSTPSRSSFLMGLAGIESINLKATFTTNTQSAALQQVSLDTATDYYTGRGIAHEVEECRCPVGYKGTSCEHCDAGYKKSQETVYMGFCIECECNGRSNECHPETGECFNCRDNWRGPQCEICPEGQIVDGRGRCVPSVDCQCDPRGILVPGCPEGRCECKVNVEGEYCDRCRSGTFNLAADNQLGCNECYCSGVSNICQSSNLYYEPLPMVWLTEGDHGFILSDRNGADIIRENFILNPSMNEIGYVFNRRQEDYYWSLPPKFAGDKVTSYGGNLMFTQRYTTTDGGYAEPNFDVILSGNGMSVYWRNEGLPRPNEKKTFSVPIKEGQWRRADPRTGHSIATRREILEILSQLSSIQIRASFGRDTLESYLSDVSLDVAIPSSSGQAALAVEFCRCPPSYTGTSCQQCEKHLYKDYDNTCKPCRCNNHEESCSIGSDNQLRCICQPGWTGRSCELRDTPTPPPPGPVIRPLIEISIIDQEPTIQIKEVGSSVRYRCSIVNSNITDGSVRLVWSKMGSELPYGRATDDSYGNLEIVDLKVSDSGTYVCTAESSVGSVTEQVVLKVKDQHVRPSISIVPASIEVREGDAIEVVCYARGTPQPSIEWQRSYNEKFNPETSIVYGTLRIPYALRSDAGRYECTARNDAGYDVKSINIYITDIPSPVIPVTITPASIDALPGEKVTLNCDVDSLSSYEVEWKRENNRPLPYYAVKSGNQLVLTRTNPEDSGVYLCIVRSRATGRTIGESTARITITSSQPSYPNITPDRQQLPQGHAAEFTCNVPYDIYSASAPIRWYKSQGEISSRAQYLSEGRILRIPHLTMNDRGIYICNSIFRGRPYNSSAMLEVERREAPTIELYPADRRQILSVGNSLLLQCRVTGIPPPSITWSRADNTSLPYNIAPSSGGVLRFNRVNLNDAGDYICTAENEAGRISLTAHIEVQSPPEIRVYPNDIVQLRAGQNLDLTCTAEGTPTPSVRWTKQDPYREFSGVTSFAAPNYGRAEYQILQVSSEDEGIYYCVAENMARTEVKSVQVTVEDSDDYPPPPTPYPPEGDSLWVALGEDTQMSCILDGNRNLERQWVRADRTDFPPGVTQRDGTLYIRAASPATEGEYVCLVLDEQGRVERRIGRYLYVKSLPEITLEPPKQVVRPGDDAEILCSARGEQPIEISWKANHTLSSHVHISGGLLSFRGITESDAGRYVCMAKNIVGLREAAAEVIVNENGIYRPKVSVVGDRAQTASEGTSLDLECRADVPGEITWTKTSGALPPNVMRFGNKLRVTRAELYNSGRYICTIQTPSGAIGTGYIDLTITRGKVCHGFQCQNGECIDNLYRCDSVADCADGSDEINCQRRRRGTHRGGLKIEPSIDIIRVGSTVDLKCITEGIPSSSIVWNKVGEDNLGENVATISPSILRIADVTTSNAGTYRCFAQTESGTHTDDYTLNVQADPPHSDPPDYDNVTPGMDATTPAPAAKTVLLKLGDTADITCANDLEPPVKYSWIRQGGLPSTATSEEGKLTLKKVTAKDSGLYTCVATNGEVKMEIPTFVVVHGTIPRFTQTSQSYLKLKTLFDALMQFDIEILFKPEQLNGLLLFNGKRHPSASGASDFVSFGLRDGYPEFKFDVGSGHATILGRSPLEMGKWVKARLIRNRKEGRLIINDEEPVIGTSPGRHHSLDLDLPLFIGSVPDFNDIPKSVDYSTGFRGCIARLVIKNEEQTLTRSGALEWTGISECDTCSENSCTNSGACQEAPNQRGYVCLCPRGFSGENCDRTGESCYPGLCGEGFCENTDKGYICKCQLGLAGPNCEHRIHIRTPYFEDNSYIAYPTPRSTEKLDIIVKMNPVDSRDGLILYAAQNDFGSGNYLSLAIRNRRLEFRMETGIGAPIVVRSNTEVIPGSWTTVTAGRDAREARLSIGHDLARATLTSGQRRELILGTNLYLGGFDSSLGSINPNVGVTDGFRGCISHIEVSRMDLDILRSSKESSNVRECQSGNPCRDSPCLNGATCQQDGNSYTCHCTPDFSGRHCDKFKNDCERYQPCGSKGECIPLSSGYRCNCAKGYSGQNCTMREHFTTSFSLGGDGWVELPKSVLADIGDETEVDMTVVTHGRDGVLMWHGQGPLTAGGVTDFFSIGVSEGRVKVIFELGSGLGEVTSNRRIDDGLPHNIRVSRSGNTISLTVDEDRVDGESEGFLSKLNAQGNVYIGGLPDARYMTNGRYIHNFNGCIKELRIQNSDDIDVSKDAVATANVVKCPV